MWKVEKQFAIRLGGNTYIDTPNLIVYQGKSIFQVRRSEEDGMLGIDFEVFDSKGQRIATFKKGIVVQGDKESYTVESGHDTYAVTEKSSGRTIARVQRRGVQGAEMDVQVHMYLPNGFLLDAGPQSTNLGGMTMTGNTFRSCGAGVVIG